LGGGEEEGGCHALSLGRRVSKEQAPQAFKIKVLVLQNVGKYRGADKSLARPGRKKARKHVRDKRDFNNIEPRALSSSFFFHPVRQDAEGN